MPELRAVEDHPEFEKLNTLVQSLVGTVRAKQNEYFAVHKQYFEGLEIPDRNSADCDGIAEHKIDEGLKPHDQQASWKDFDPTVFYKNATMPFHVKIDIYKTPKSGWGWVLGAAFRFDGDRWNYTHDEGPGLGLPHQDEWYIKEGPGPV